MKAVLEACQQYGAKLVFFDNVYMYDKAAISFMTEDAPLNPPSKKGLVRTAVFEMITSAVANEKLTALVARAADFYGPDNKNSALGKMVVNNFLAGKKAQSFGKPEMVHTYTYTPDAAKATALLGNTEDVWNQVWHLPTTKELITGQQWIELFAKEMGIEPKTQHISNWMLRLLGLFIPVMREFPEMMYQYEQDYIFDSTKFERRFGWGATPPAEGVKITLEQTKSL
jgi:nucleoside-diphosphate-sugar epimerase